MIRKNVSWFYISVRAKATAKVYKGLFDFNLAYYILLPTDSMVLHTFVSEIDKCMTFGIALLYFIIYF